MMRGIAILLVFVGIMGVGFVSAQDKSGHVIIGTGKDELGYSVIQTRDGGYMLVGVRVEDPITKKMYVVKLDKTGALEWAHVLGRFYPNLEEYGVDLLQTRDGGYVVVGTTVDEDVTMSVDLLVVKLDSLGAIQWAKKLGGGGDEEVFEVLEDDDGGLVMVGFSYLEMDTLGSTEPLGLNILVVKLRPDGDLEWSRLIDEGVEEFGFSITKANDGGFVIAGGALPDYSLPGMYLAKLDENGDLVWSRVLNETYGVVGKTVVAVPGRGYVVMGNRVGDFREQEQRLYLVEVDEDGHLTSAYYYDIDRDSAEYLGAGDMVALEDGGYAIVATSHDPGDKSKSTAVVLRLHKDGRVAWAHRIRSNKSAQLMSVIRAQDSSLVMAGSSISSGRPDWDLWLLKLTPKGNFPAACMQELNPLGAARDTAEDLRVDLAFSGRVFEGRIPAPTPHVMDTTSIGSSELCGQFFVPEMKEKEENALKLVRLENGQGWRLDFPDIREEVELVVFDVMGHEVFRRRAQNVNRVRIELPRVESVYILKANTEVEQLLYKLY